MQARVCQFPCTVACTVLGSVLRCATASTPMSVCLHVCLCILCVFFGCNQLVFIQIKEDTWYNDASGTRRTKVTQYHDVIGSVTGRRWLAEFAKVVTVVELVGLCVAQIIAGSSNLFSLYSGLPKRCASLQRQDGSLSLSAWPLDKMAASSACGRKLLLCHQIADF